MEWGKGCQYLPATETRSTVQRVFTLEQWLSTWAHQNIGRFRPHPRPVTSVTLGVAPRKSIFKSSSGDSNEQPNWRTFALNQWSPTFLASGTGFMKDNFSMDWCQGWEGMVSGWFKCVTFKLISYCAAWFLRGPNQYHSLARGWGPLL